jgi:hypothetical protein
MQCQVASAFISFKNARLLNQPDTSPPSSTVVNAEDIDSGHNIRKSTAVYEYDILDP